MTPETTARLLKFAALGTALFGLALALASHFGGKAVVDLFLDLAFLPLDSGQGSGAPETLLALAISGGLMVGLGVLVWQVASLVLPQDPRLARRLLIPTLLAWYLPDSLGSYLSGALFNVVMNTGFLALFLIPLALMQEDQVRAAHKGLPARP